MIISNIGCIGMDISFLEYHYLKYNNTKHKENQYVFNLKIYYNE